LIVSSVSNSGNGVIEVSSTVRGIQDSGLVVLEVGIGLNSNASWLGIDGSLQLLVRSLWNGSVGSGLHDLLISGGLARSTGSSSVWVRGLELLWVSLCIGESMSLKSTIATSVLLNAINELLFGELEKLSSLNEMLSLHGGGGRESPAGTTLTLVLDWVNGSLSSPVNGGREVGSGELGDRVVLNSWLSSKMSLELLLSHGRELVVLDNVEVLWLRVDLLELGISLGELVKSESVFSISSIGETILGNVLNKLLFDGKVGVRDDIALVDSSVSNSLADDVHD